MVANARVTPESIRQAAAVIAGNVEKTPCFESRTLSEATGARVWLKFESHQFTSSFKERGALNKLSSLSAAERAAGVLAVSAGNHAQGVAYHAQRLGIRALIVMPRLTPHVKVQRTRRFGAEVVLTGETFDEAKTAGLALAAERGLVLIHPYDDEHVISGQGTVALEMLAAQPALDAIIVPVGGGGLIAGIAVAAKGVNPDIEILGVETESYPAVHCALRGAAPAFAHTIAEGIALKEPGSRTLPIIREKVADVVLVSESEIEQAIVMLLEAEKAVVEGAGAAPLAALVRYGERFRGRRVGLVVSGGNIDPLLLSEIITRGLVKAGRLARLRVRVRDLPGSLARVTACLAAADANIEEVHHQRAFAADLPLQQVEIEFVLQTRGPEHVRELLAALDRAGFPARVTLD
jgi:threonine dehydratase